MQKFTLTILAATIMLSSTLSNAEPTSSLSQYYSKQAAQAKKATKNLLHPLTDITVINATSNYIIVEVPGSTIYDWVSPGYNDHIINYNVATWYNVVIRDQNQYQITAVNACREAILTVYGYPGHYSQNLDTDLCT